MDWSQAGQKGTMTAYLQIQADILNRLKTRILATLILIFGLTTHLLAQPAFVQGRHGKIHYEYAPAQAQCSWQATTVLIHGFSTPMWAWDHVYDAISSSGCSVLRFDLHGRGLSDSASLDTLGTFADEIDDLLQDLNIQGPLNLIGWSMGGAITANYAKTHSDQVSKVVLVAPFSQKKDLLLINSFLWDWVMVGLVSQFEPEWGYRHNLANPDEFDQKWPAYAEKFREIRLTEPLAKSLLSSTRNIITQDQTDNYRWLGSSGIPILLVWGQEDTVVPYRESEILRKAMPKARFAPIQNAGHAPQLEQPNAVIPGILDFLKTPNP